MQQTKSVPRQHIYTFEASSLLYGQSSWYIDQTTRQMSKASKAELCSPMRDAKPSVSIPMDGSSHSQPYAFVSKPLPRHTEPTFGT